MNPREEKAYAVEELLSLVRVWHTKRNVHVFDGDPIKLGSDRYKTFKVKGVTCVRCGVVGRFFAKRASSDGSYHMNLFAVRPDGSEVLMTKDHIVPRSRGGKDHLSNYQPMCATCNTKKGNRPENARAPA